MKHFSFAGFLAIFLTVLFSPSLTVHAQNPTATPPDDVLKISTTLIQVDVTVTDKNGKIVTDLKPEDFEVYENDKKQDITNFSFVTVNPDSAPNETVGSPKTTKNSIPLPPVKLKAEQVRRTYALVVDDLGLNFGSVVWVKDSLKKFVNEQMREGDLVAVIRTGGGIGALQSFTSDKRQLMAAIEKIKWNGQGRSGISTFDPIRPTLKEELAGRVRDGEVRNPQGGQQDNDFAREIEEFRNESFSVGTLGSLNYIIRGMRDLPGRKAVMLFSEGFALTYSGKSDRVPKPNRILNAMRVLADLANRSSVVLYTLDPRGLLEPGMFSAEDDVMDNFASYALEGRENRERNFAESQHSLRYLAYETGGFPFVNQNSLDLGMRRVIADQSGYYLLGYQPDSETFDPKKNKFNDLKIKLNRPGLKIRYRSGFFGITDEKYRNTPQKSPQQKLNDALVSPFGASEINLDLYSIFYNDDRDRDFIRSLIYINPQDLTFTIDADGSYRTKFEVRAMIFDAEGAAASNQITAQELKFTKEGFARMQAKGLIYDLPVAVVKTGAYQFRIALRDTATGKIGAVSQFIEVPNLKKNKLTLSNLILTNFTLEEWKRIASGQQAANEKSALFDTTLRRFKRGTFLRYNYVIYNARTNGAQKPQLQIQTRLIRDGKILFEDSPTAYDDAGQTDLKRLQNSGAITLGSDLEPGNYVLQVIAFDNGDGGGRAKSATQFVEFEIVN